METTEEPEKENEEGRGRIIVHQDIFLDSPEVLEGIFFKEGKKLLCDPILGHHQLRDALCAATPYEIYFTMKQFVAKYNVLTDEVKICFSLNIFFVLPTFLPP